MVVGYCLEVTTTSRHARRDLSDAEAGAIAVALAAVGPCSSACNQAALETVIAALTSGRS